MTALRTRPLLIGVAATMALAAVVFLIQPPDVRIVRTTTDVRALATRIAEHPMDRDAASALAEVALDTKLDNRIELWRSAYRHASLLAPEGPEPATGFARAAFFHWTELSERDKKEALAAYTPLLRDPAVFHRMAEPLFELTGDLEMLQRAGPPTAATLGSLIELALPNGRFADYRALRAKLRQERIDDFAGRRTTATPEDLVAQFPSPPYHADVEPLIAGLLEELHRRPLDESPDRAAVLDAIIDYALRHDLRPLDGLEAVTRIRGAASMATQIKLSRELGLKQRTAQLEAAYADPRRVEPNPSEWQGLCQGDLCDRAWRTIEATHGIALTLATVKTDEVPAYVEIYVDDVLRDEGEVGTKRDFIVPAGGRDTHRIEVVLANPVTRNRLPRRVHIASITTL